MTLVTGLAVYVVVWWIVLFAVLPWGVKPPETFVPGQAESAPENPRLLQLRTNRIPAYARSLRSTPFVPRTFSVLPFVRVLFSPS